MAPPSIKIDVEPFESGKAQYLPLGAKSSGGMTGVKICLRFRLENTGATTAKVTGIKYVFPGSAQPSFTMEDVNLASSLTCQLGWLSSGLME
jgi:hypothetical protein